MTYRGGLEFKRFDPFGVVPLACGRGQHLVVAYGSCMWTIAAIPPVLGLYFPGRAVGPMTNHSHPCRSRGSVTYTGGGSRAP